MSQPAITSGTPLMEILSGRGSQPQGGGGADAQNAYGAVEHGNALIADMLGTEPEKTKKDPAPPQDQAAQLGQPGGMGNYSDKMPGNTMVAGGSPQSGSFLNILGGKGFGGGGGMMS